jgi:hypothetical protein
MRHPIRTADVNPLAVASVVFGILGFVALPLVGAVLALLLGWIAERQIAVTGDAGSRVARAGSILGASWFILAALLLLFTINLSRS